MEVEDEGHARVQRFMVVGAILQYEAKQDRCINLGSHALKVVAYIRCFINKNLYNNFDEETCVDILWRKIRFMFENKNTINRVVVFKKIVRLRY